MLLFTCAPNLQRLLLVPFRYYIGDKVDQQEDGMHVRFSEVDEHYIKSKVESGFYTSENEVVRDAVRRMREEDERIARFQAAVRLGDEQIARGETVPYSKELMDKSANAPCNAPSRATRSIIPMSSPECYTLHLSRQAEKDIEGIL